MSTNNKYEGKDNYGRPRSQYLEKIALMSNDDLQTECYWMIYHSARCNNNPRADWHWMVDACYDEVRKRDSSCEIYKKAYRQCIKDHVG